EHKASLIERFNRTLKTIMWKKFTEERSQRWLEILPELLDTYNNKIHSALSNRTPKEASDPELEEEIWEDQYGDYVKKMEESKNDEKNDSILQLGDWVRISKVKGTFEKGYTNNFSTEIFKIVEKRFTNPITFILEDYNGEILKGSFYEEE